ncbi:BA14K family protein [Aliihoeflea sp. 40Bstr573]|uniref:BA14K family protein n=1 Tax=Aliihoeflea sp. 40Bstr573 TaxID=2696467 RepID=UPI002094243D|nr:BA14K family protein [Aliihoeflea sp. 40Bstr573]MCO6388306.1 BA14K family protein [Aliihoeflea sp. 40Bstr573]
MKKFLSIVCAATVAFTGVAATSVTASASPALIRAVDSGVTNANVIEVQNRRETRRDRREFRQDRRQDRREFRQEMRQDRREFRQDVRQARRGFYRDGNYSYYNGHRGYRDRRAGYREFNGFWFPAAAFVAGAIVSGAISQPSRTVVVRPGRLSQAHVDWCYDRYRSYRASDNTFQPYNGPRKACYSPYS